jgi:hypothetical protein
VAERPPELHKPAEDREIDYLICNTCSTPCYIFETNEGSVTEAQCLVCGNDDPKEFNLGEQDSDDD